MAIDYRTRYQNLGKSDWFNKHYDNKSVSEEEVKNEQEEYKDKCTNCPFNETSCPGGMWCTEDD